MTTADKIARAARRILDKEGADAVSTRRVAAAVGITAMALYRHYDNRDGLLNALADAGFADLAFVQTLFRPLEEIEEAEPVRDGHGEGSFVAIRGTVPASQPELASAGK